MPKSMKIAHKNAITLNRPTTDLIRAETCILRLGMVFIAFKGLKILRVRNARILTPGSLAYSSANSKHPPNTITKSSRFHPFFKYVWWFC